MSHVDCPWKSPSPMKRSSGLGGFYGTFGGRIEYMTVAERFCLISSCLCGCPISEGRNRERRDQMHRLEASTHVLQRKALMDGRKQR